MYIEHSYIRYIAICLIRFQYSRRRYKCSNTTKIYVYYLYTQNVFHFQNKQIKHTRILNIFRNEFTFVRNLQCNDFIYCL